MYRFSVVSAAIAAALAGPAWADDAVRQPEVVVTANGLAQTVETTLADVDVITREQIDRSGARDLSDLLREQAGVDVARTGGPGSQTSVFLRGTNSNHVLVLIDGVRVASATNGLFSFEQLPLDTVQRIEIVRGPRASYWGSDAIGGVIQIFTRRLDGPRVAAGYGTYADANASVGIGHWSDAGGFSVQVGHRDLRGFPSQNENGYSYTGEDDGLRHTHLAARGSLALGTQTLGATLLRTQGRVDFAGGSTDEIEQAADVSLGGALSERWEHALSVGTAREDLDTPAYFTLYQTRRQTLGWRNRIGFGPDQAIVAGFDFVHETGEQRDTFGQLPVYSRSRNNTGAYAGWQGRFGAFDGDVAVRHDHNSVFGDADTGSAAFGWRFDENLRAYASFGQGFRAPSLNEQYSPGFGGLFAGNPLLDPERSRSTELGLEWTPSEGQRLRANAFTTRINGLISFTGTDFQAENIAHASIDGTELAYDGRFGEWRLQGAYTWQDPRNADTDTQLLRRPKQKLTAGVERALGERIHVGVQALYSGRRDDVGGVVLPSYAIANVYGSYAFGNGWSLNARVENLTDRDYELVHGYNTPGRSGFLEVVWQPR